MKNESFQRVYKKTSAIKYANILKLIIFAVQTFFVSELGKSYFTSKSIYNSRRFFDQIQNSFTLETQNNLNFAYVLICLNFLRLSYSNSTTVFLLPSSLSIWYCENYKQNRLFR